MAMEAVVGRSGGEEVGRRRRTWLTVHLRIRCLSAAQSLAATATTAAATTSGSPPSAAGRVSVSPPRRRDEGAFPRRLSESRRMALSEGVLLASLSEPEIDKNNHPI